MRRSIESEWPRSGPKPRLWQLELVADAPPRAEQPVGPVALERQRAVPAAPARPPAPVVPEPRRAQPPVGLAEQLLVGLVERLLVELAPPPAGLAVQLLAALVVPEPQHDGPVCFETS